MQYMWQRMIGFQQRLEVGQHHLPATRNTFEHFGVTLQVFMADRQANEPVDMWLDGDGHTCMFGIVRSITGPGPVLPPTQNGCLDEDWTDVERSLVMTVVLP